MVNMLALLLACQHEEPAQQPAPEPQPEALSDLELLARLSLDLRGTRPTEAEITAVEADPTKIDELIDSYLNDPGFGEQVFYWYADLYRTRAEAFVVGADGDGELLEEGAKARFLHSVGDEPLRILERTANDGRPWTDIVTADWTMADENLIDTFWLEPLEDGDGWIKAQYTDGRPGSGVLTTNGMWWRYISTAENLNRSRAEAILRLLVCDHRFEQPVEFSGAAASIDELQDRAQTDSSCLACHVVLDPVGSYLYGYWRAHPESYTEALTYYPLRERAWEDLSGVAPAWYGEPGDTLHELGQQIANDDRFVSCAVEQAFTFMTGDDVGEASDARFEQARQDFLDSGLVLRDLYRSIATDAWYRSADPTFEDTVPLRRLTPARMSSAVGALTGYTWEYYGLDMLVTDKWGVRVLAGGLDGVLVTLPATDHSATEVLAVQRLAELASTYAVSQEAQLAASERVLFREIEDLSATPDEATLRAQLAALVLRAHTRRLAVDDAEITSLVELWNSVATESGDPAQAHTMVLGALLRHPDFLQY